MNSIDPLTLSELWLPSLDSGSSSSCLNISEAAAKPFCIWLLISDNCLTGFANIPAAVKKAINVPGDIVLTILVSNANQVINAKAAETKT